MDCPDCDQAPLEEKEVATDLIADVCPRCAGVWLDPGELERIGSGKSGFSQTLTNAMKALVPSTPACPGCSSSMGILWLEDAKIELKSCPGCKGSWLANKRLRDLRAYVNPGAVRPAPRPPEPVTGGESLLMELMPSMSGQMAAVGSIVAYFVFIGVLLYAPPQLTRWLPRKNAAAAAPAPAPAPAAEVPAPRGPSESEIRAMIQAEVKSNLKPAKKLQIRSGVDSPSYESPTIESRVALVVGVEDYADLPAAEFASNDANAVHEHLLALGFAPRNVLLLTGRDATKGKLNAAFNSWLPKHAAAGSTVFFYFSGHGAPDPSSGQAYLVPVDGAAEDLPDTALSLKEVYSRLASLKAKRVLVALDSCFSGLGGRSVLAKGMRPLVPRVDPASSGTSRITVLSASGPDQVSNSLPEEGHGAFTYYLLEGLNGAAMDSTRAITVSSLYRYLTPKVQDAARLQKRDQTPQMAAGSEPEFVLRR